jgi:hypothetical protein
MYCYNCGKKIINGMRKCPYCNTIFKDMLELELYNTLDQIGEKITLFDREREITFSLGENIVRISGERYLICCTEKLVTMLDNSITPNILDFIRKSSFDDMIYNGEKFFSIIIKKIELIILSVLLKNNCDIISNIKKMNMIFEYAPFSIWEPIYKMALRAKEFKDKAVAWLDARGKTEEIPWAHIELKDGGYVKQIIQSDILNEDIIATDKKGKSLKAVMEYYNVADVVKEMDEFENEIIERIGKVYSDIRDFLNMGLIGCNEDNLKVIESISRPKDVLTFTKMSEVEAFNKLIDNPLNYNAYTSLYIFDNTLGPELSKIANFCGIETEVLSYFLCYGDGDIFDNEELGLKPIGFDTDIRELERIKSTLVRIEKNNPIYLRDYNIIDYVNREQDYHRKVDEIINLNKISDAKQLVNKTFSSKNLKLAIQELLEYNDLYINNLVFKKLSENIIDIHDTKNFIKQFEGYLPSILVDVILIYEYNKKNDDISFNNLFDAAKLGSPYAMAYIATILYSGCKFIDKDDKLSMYYFKRAARYQSSLAIAYIGMFYNRGIMGLKYRPDIGNLYLKIAEAYGEGLATREFKRK